MIAQYTGHFNDLNLHGGISFRSKFDIYKIIYTYTCSQIIFNNKNRSMLIMKATYLPFMESQCTAMRIC